MSFPEITQDNVHIFIPLKVAKVTEMLTKDKNIIWEEALLEVYNSNVYSVLEKEDTKMWYEGPTYLYKELKSEAE
ncbi:hypothetical protein [Clostridium sp. C8-1-8]|uniref:hypothetical protein n=1 Tax=Clostridium sp. C8-1-8 TaxID=2698831 RepID=UPI0013685C9A|nr:hypothetical protein [Clostridium sp. C8-1-8]